MARTRKNLQPTEAISADLPKPAKEERATKRRRVKEVVSDEDVLRQLKKKSIDKRAALSVKDAILKPKRGAAKPVTIRKPRQAKGAQEKKVEKPVVKRVRRKATV